MPIVLAKRWRLINAALLAGTCLAVLDIASLKFAGPGEQTSTLALVELVRLLVVVPISLAFVGRLSAYAAGLMALIGPVGMIGMPWAYVVLLRMQVVSSSSPIQWTFFLSSVAFQVIGTAGLARWILEYVRK